MNRPDRHQPKGGMIDEEELGNPHCAGAPAGFHVHSLGGTGRGSARGQIDQMWRLCVCVKVGQHPVLYRSLVWCIGQDPEKVHPHLVRQHDLCRPVAGGSLQEGGQEHEKAAQETACQTAQASARHASCELPDTVRGPSWRYIVRGCPVHLLHSECYCPQEQHLEPEPHLLGAEALHPHQALLV